MWKAYGKDGNLVAIHNYKNGTLTGKEIWKYKNKKTGRIVNYKNGKVVWYKDYNEDGTLISKKYNCE